VSRGHREKRRDYRRPTASEKQPAWIGIVYRLPDATPLAHYVLLAMSVLPWLGGVFISVRYGQGGTRLGSEPLETLNLEGKPPIGDRTPDSCWKFGQIYFNPDDPAIWIEKRAGVGYTLNFGRPVAWAILFAILFAPLIVVALLRG